jgi:alpha-D-xyloside xylohydrolase
LKEVRGEGQALVFARSATAGGQQFPVHWGGDSTATFESMAESLRGGLSLGLAGFGFWSHDIGGFEQSATADVYKRWVAFGLLSSHSRLHGSSSYRVPWAYDEEAVDVLAKFTRLKCSLMPYLFGAAREAHTRGLPVLRAMLLEFPNDPACETLDRQYMLGENLLVAPVMSCTGMVDYYVPAGPWTNLLNGSVVEGPRWVCETHDFMSLPLLARPDSVIPVGNRTDRPDYDYADGLTLQAYALQPGEKTVIIPDLSGQVAQTFTLRCTASRLEVQQTGAAKPWQLLLVGIGSVQSVEGSIAEVTPSGVLVTPHADAGHLLVRLVEEQK